MRILLTNDDGIYSEGIQKLSEHLAADHEVYVVAPDHERSATGHAITMHRPLRAERVEHSHQQSEKAWAVNGTPSDCVKLAVEALIKETPPDIVVSGINKGNNLGTDVFYSGTVSAAVEAVILGLPAVAVSMDSINNCANFSVAANFTCKLVKMIQSHRVKDNTVFNVNLPDLPQDEIKGTRITSLGVRRYQNSFEKRVDPRGKTYYWLAGELIKKENEGDNTDVKAVEMGFISITPLKFALTDNQMMETLKSWDIP